MSTLCVVERSDSDMVYSPSSTLCTTSPPLRSYASPVIHVPRLEFDSFDTLPFSASFSNLFDGELEDSQTSMANGNMSYDIEQFTNLKELDSEWDDDDIDEIVIMAPKSSGRLPTIVEDVCKIDTVLPETVAISDFELLEYSSLAKAKLCRKRDTNRLYALKIFPNCFKTGSTESVILNVIDGLRAPFLPPVYWSFQDEHELYMVVEYYPRDNLFKLIAHHGACRADHALFYASEIAQGLRALHAAGIVHRDLSAENVMIATDGHIVLTGFEYASSIELLQETQRKDRKPSSSSAMENQAPEVLLGWTHDFAVDCWGFGILLHLLLSGVHPFRTDDLTMTREYLLKTIVRDPIVFHPLLEHVARDLISKCLERNPVVRLNMVAVRKHDYFSSIKWEEVVAKKLQVPHISNTTSHNFNFGAGYRKTMNNDFCPELCKRDQSSERKLLQLSSLILEHPRTSQTVATSGQRHLQELPKVSRMSSLLDDIPESVEETSPNLKLGPSVPSALVCNNLSAEDLVVQVAAQERMAKFWEMLDSEQPSIPVLSPLDFTDAIAPRSRKLRKARSSIYPEHRFSTLSTLSLHNKLRKKPRPMSGVLLTSERQIQKQPVLDLPTGVKKIGSGIGFTYTLPAAAGSKASICSNVPSTCHNMLQTRLPVLALGLRLASELCKTMTKTKTKRIPAQEDYCHSETFTPDSCWSLVMPIAASVDPTSTLPSTTSNSDSSSSSPMSETSPLTPDMEECRVMEDGFEGDAAHEIRERDPVSTLRLVSSSKYQGSEGFSL